MQQQQQADINNKSTKKTTISALPNAIAQDEEKNWPILHEAASTGNETLLASLLKGGMLRTATSRGGNTALHEAAWRGYSRCVGLLCSNDTLQQTAVESRSSGNKFTCMLRKRKKCTQDTQRAPDAHRILLGMQNHAGFTALHLAAQQGHNQCCRELLMAGADADVQNKYGDTALHTACRYGHAGAARILLSASCDANRLNLNGDSPLHISTAMRRRKLTRILLTEGDCNVNIKNAQNETPLDIAIRKSYVEIFDILNNQERLRQQRKQRSKQSKATTTEEKKSKTMATAGGGSSDKTSLATDAINWSPYGCHYFPDPRAFPAPKLETIPKEPLQQGEQYYCDLNGCIRKGPIGVGSTCYCAPFFRHIEHKINSNRRSLRKYVHNAKATLGHKVKALAERTNQQIEQLTRDMICDRVRCESRRRHIDYWLQYAAATQHNEHDAADKTSRKNATKELEEVDGGVNDGMRKFSLSRCQSLDALSEHKSSIFMQLSNLKTNNAQSLNLLEDLPTSSKDKYVNSTPTDKQSIAGEVSDNNNNNDDDDDDDEHADHDDIGNEIMACKNKNEENETKILQGKYKQVKFNDKIENEEEEKETQKSVLQLVKEQEKLLGKQVLYKNVNFRINESHKQRHKTEREQEEEEETAANEQVQKLQHPEQFNIIYDQQKSKPWQKHKGSHKFTIKAEIVQNGNGDYDDDDAEKLEDEDKIKHVLGTHFVVTEEKMGTPSYAQLKKTSPTKFSTEISNERNPNMELASALENVHLIPTPIMSDMSTGALEALSDNNTEEDDDDDDDDSEADHVDHHEHEIDYLYELRKTLQTNSKIDLTEHVRALEKPAIGNIMENQQNLTSNYSERVVPKNAYFHPLPNKMQYQNNSNINIINNNNNNIISNNNNVNHINNNNNNNMLSNYNANNHVPMMMMHKTNRPQNILNLTNGQPNGFLNHHHHDPRLERRRPFIGQEQDQLNGNSYISPVNSNSGSSIASSTDYERALRKAAIYRQSLSTYMKPKTHPPQLPYNAMPQHHQTHQIHNYVDQRTLVQNGQNNHAYVVGSLEPASSQLIYSANTVALALSDGQTLEDIAEGSTNGGYPLISSLV